MRIVVAGGTGLLGRALVSALRTEGHQVAVLTRRPREPGDVAWSPAEGQAVWTEAESDVDAVVNLAGEPIAEQRWTVARKAQIRSSRAIATRALVAAITRARGTPAVFVSASAVGFYGTRGSELITENSAPGSDFLASVCTEWEGHALEAASTTRVVLLRSGVVLSRTGGALPQLARPFRLFAGGPLGSGRQYLSWIHLEDWVAMVRWALTTTALSGPLNVTAPEPVTNAEFARVLGHVLHRPAIMPTPAFALRLALGEMADAMILGGQRVLPIRAQESGFTFRYPRLQEALATIYGHEDTKV